MLRQGEVSSSDPCNMLISASGRGFVMGNHFGARYHAEGTPYAYLSLHSRRVLLLMQAGLPISCKSCNREWASSKVLEVQHFPSLSHLKRRQHRLLMEALAMRAAKPWVC